MPFDEISLQLYEKCHEYFKPSADAVPLLGVKPKEPSKARRFKGPAQKMGRLGMKAAGTAANVAEKTGFIASSAPVTAPITAAKWAIQVRGWFRQQHHAMQLAVYWELAKEDDSGAREGTADAIAFAVAQKKTKLNRGVLQSILPGYDKLIEATHRVTKTGRGEARAHWARVLKSNAGPGLKDEWAQLAVQELVGPTRYTMATNPRDPQGKGLGLIMEKLSSKA